MPFQDLVVAAQQGDETAFSELVGRFYSLVHGLALSTAGNWSAAEDITQEVFFLAWKNMRNLKHPRAFPVWLRRIARNTALNWLRNQRYRQALAGTFSREAGGHMEGPDDPAGTVARTECLERIGDALDGLSPKLREAMILYYLEGNTVKESAQALGIKDDTMKKRLRLGRQRLHTHYIAKEDATLEQLLPYSPRLQVQRIMAGLALGPAAPALSTSLSASPSVLGVHHLIHGGSLATLKEAGLTAVLLPLIAAVLAAMALAGAGTAYLASATTSSHETTAYSWARPPEGVDCYEGTGIITSKHWGDPRLGDHLVVEHILPGYPCDAAGMRPGDRVIEVNGHPVNEEYWKDKTHRFAGKAGTNVRVTVMRPKPDGTEQKMTFRVTRGYVPRHLQQKAHAQYAERLGAVNGPGPE